MDFNICPGAGIVDLSAKYLFSHKPERISALPHWKNTRSTWMRKTERGSALLYLKRASVSSSIKISA